MLNGPGFDYVRAAIIYNLRNKGWDPADREGNYGLVRRDYVLKPGYFALKSAATLPETSITSGPAGRTSARTASFEFASSEPGSTFQCRLDAGPWEGCASPRSYPGLPPGEHRFEVRAVDDLGDVDPTPAIWAWTVEADAAPGDPRTAGAARIVASRRGRTVSRARTVSVGVRCPLTEPGDCAGSVTLARAGRRGAGERARPGTTLGRAPFHIRRGQSRAVRVRLSARGLRLVRRARRLRVVATVFSSQGGREVRTARTTFTLRAGGARRGR